MFYNKYSNKIFIRFLFLLCFFTNITYANNRDISVITVGGGNEGGVFIKVAKSLCRITNKYYLEEGILCKAIYTEGGKDNFYNIMDGNLDFAVTKLIKYPMRRKNTNNVFDKDFLLISPLHNEYLTLLVRKNAKINGLNDLINKKVNIGAKGSASNFMMQKFFQKYGYKLNNIYNYKILDSVKKICDGKIDAILYFIGHPNKTYQEVLNICDVKIISLTNSEIKKLIEFSDSFQKGEINSSLYKNVFFDIKTVYSQSVLIAKNNINPRYLDIIQDITNNYKDELLKASDIYEQIRFMDLYEYKSKK